MRGAKKTVQLSIFLLKEGVTVETAVPDAQTLKRHSITLGNRSKADLFLRPPTNHPPSWAGLFRDQVKLSEAYNASTAAVFLVRQQKRVFALTFGTGRYLLKPGCWEENFGLKATVNAIDPETVRSIDTKSFDTLARHTREQASRAGRVEEFSIEYEQDLLRSVTGSPADQRLGNKMTGMDSLAVTIAADLRDIPGLLDSVLAKSREDGYKDAFPWIDHLGEVRDPDLISKLDAALIEKVRSKDQDRLWLAVPSIVNWSTIAGFAYSRAKSAPRYADLHVQEFLAGEDVASVTVHHLRNRIAFCFSAENDSILEKWPVYQCIYAEVDEDGTTFLLSDGKWYRVDTDFVTRINKQVAAILAPSIALPDCKEKTEEDYNKRVCASSKDGFALMDQKNISYGGGRSRIEFCDIFTKSNVLVHVKQYSGSKVLSHLFAQGVVSAESFLDKEFRDALNEKLPKSHRFADTSQRPDATRYEVAFAVISKSAKKLVLPFFSRLNLHNARRRLDRLGYKVSLGKVQMK